MHRSNAPPAPPLKCNVAHSNTSPLHPPEVRGSSCRHVSGVIFSLASDLLFNSQPEAPSLIPQLAAAPPLRLAQGGGPTAVKGEMKEEL